MTVEYCGDGFCKPQKSSIDSACHDLSKEAGKWIMYQNAGKTCYCVCSCLGEGTLVTEGSGSEIKVQDMVEKKTTVLASGKDLQFQSKLVNYVAPSKAGETKNTIYLSYSVNGKPVTERVLTMDHPMILSNKVLVGAGALQMDDKLLDQNGNEVAITSLRYGSYIGQFWEFATDMTKPNTNYDGHLVLTEGIVTGDAAISVYENYPTDASQVSVMGLKDRPLIGSKEWIKRNGVNPCFVEDGPIEMEYGVFVPAEHYAVEIPEYAGGFLPRKQAWALEEYAPKEPISNGYVLDMCEYVVEMYQMFYPDINFLFNWYDDNVNSYSWVDDISNEQTVYLSGGLARIVGFDMEGLFMAMAHEVGHLMGKPKLDDGLTCEGSADWFAGTIVLRTLWYGEEYFAKTKIAISQLELLYYYIADIKEDVEEYEAPYVDEVGQPYPSNHCRIKTYKTAMSSPIQPECSLCDCEDDDEDDYYIADGSDQFEEEECDVESLAKSSGARDRQRRKKRRLEESEDELLAKSSGARDRQRRKKRRLEESEDELLAKSSGARDRQRRKKRILEESEGELLAKSSGARDRQRRKKRRFEESEGELLAKSSGARDRQRRKKRRFEETEEGVMAKVSGARDRQRKKKH